MNQAHNIYIHIPFCLSKCNYCAFFSRACTAPDWCKYADGIISEITYWGNTLGKISIPTVFFGGGTPSLMPTDIFERIMIALHNTFTISDDCEITLESNPGTINSSQLCEFQSCGVNRLSVGVQSFDNNRLKFLGRHHTSDDAIKLLECAMSRGMRVSGDFIYGLPGDTPDDVIKTCNHINKLGITHCSMYELTIEPNTPFGKMNLCMPSDDMMADMYNAISDTLCLARYEVSNYATPGNECRHNMNVWDGMPYIGIGQGASGRILLNRTWYEQRGNNEQFDVIDSDTRATEMVITGLRQTRGVRITPTTKRIINFHMIDLHPELFVLTQDNRIATTKSGMLILDNVTERLIK